MQVYLINLARRPDRLKIVSNHLDALGLKFIRVDAVDGTLAEINKDSLVDPGLDACWQSHQLVFSLAERNASPYVLVLEDDAVLTHRLDWPNLLSQFERYMSENAIDVLQLGFVDFDETRGLALKSYLKLSSLIRSLIIPNIIGEPSYDPDPRWSHSRRGPGNTALKPNEFGPGSHCYIIDKNAARIFLNYNRPTFLSPDDFFDSVASPHYRRFKIARLERSLASQRGRKGQQFFDSDIEPLIQRFRAGVSA